MTRLNSLGNSGLLISTLDSNGFIGRYSSITIGLLDKLPIISYYDQTNGNLKVIHCGYNRGLQLEDTFYFTIDFVLARYYQ